MWSGENASGPMRIAVFAGYNGSRDTVCRHFPSFHCDMLASMAGVTGLLGNLPRGVCSMLTLLMSHYIYT